ncbi:uncharacterized protein LOC135709785 [Ochlerotatus camptorhynchus]|uniref:uncharacterized protein LOC135709785 n=1 Tax=Ochlerotatus camptorhynchus TaxID=644619 RepID=UPI0031D64203
MDDRDRGEEDRVGEWLNGTREENMRPSSERAPSTSDKKELLSEVTKSFAGAVACGSGLRRDKPRWHEAWEEQEVLPISFLHKYSSIQSIIDCFEIQIMKPSSPVFQSITYLQYKSCNTLKYLISCTSCGFVTFISKAFPGRASDQKIDRRSGYLDMIHPGAGVLADRGFKNVATDIATLVSNDEPLSKEDSILAKEIASVRIHVERFIRRFREYKIWIS